jgi:hypothetical protein
VRYLVSGPAMDRLGWILDGLNGAADWGGDAADVLAPEFTARVAPDGSMQVVTCTVEPAAPHRISGTRMMALIPPFGGYHMDDPLRIGAELLTTLAFRQLDLGQSAILDFPAEDLATRARWQSLARAAGAEFRVVVCVCMDRDLHRARLEHRERGIPGWHDGGNWANVERRLAEFPPWTGEVLTVDAGRPLAQNLSAVLEYVTG